MFSLLLGPQLLIALAVLALRKHFPWLAEAGDVAVRTATPPPPASSTTAANDHTSSDTDVPDDRFFRVEDPEVESPHEVFVLRYRRPWTYDRAAVLRRMSQHNGVRISELAPRMLVLDTDEARAKLVANDLGPDWMLLSAQPGYATPPSPPTLHPEPKPATDPQDEYVTVIATLIDPASDLPANNSREYRIAHREAVMAPVIRATNEFLEKNNLQCRGGGYATGALVIEGRRRDIDKLSACWTVTNCTPDTPLRRVE